MQSEQLFYKINSRLMLTKIENFTKFPEILARIKKLGGEQYQANIEGKLDQFELSASDNFIGLLPGGDFVIDFWIDRAVSKVTSKVAQNEPRGQQGQNEHSVKEKPAQSRAANTITILLDGKMVKKSSLR